MAINPQRLGADHGNRSIKVAALRLSDEPSRSTKDYAEVLVGDGAPSGGYGRDGGVTMLYVRKDASSVGTAVYVTVNGGTDWTAMNPAILSSLDLDGEELILDAAGTTSLTADTDNQIDIKINSADDFRFVANIFRALSGSSIETDTINETTSATGVTIDGLLIKDGIVDADTGWRKTTTTINNAAVRTLNATPVSIISAPGAGKAIVDVRVNVKYVYNTAAFDSVGSSDDLEFRYTDGSGTKVANDIETTGFLDQTSDQYRMSGPVLTSSTPVANAAVVARIATGEVYSAAGGGSLVVQAFYRIVTL